MRKIQTLYNVSIYCITDEITKTVAVHYTTKIIPDNAVIIETHKKMNILYCKYRVHDIYCSYILSGYTPISSYKPLHWKLVVRLGDTYRGTMIVDFSAFVRVKTSANIEYTVKSFKTIAEANDFVQNNSIVQVLLMYG